MVLHHGNSANSGHYTSYIRDTLGEGKWTPPEFKPKRASASGAKHSAGHTNDFEMRKFGPDAPLRLLVTILVTGKRDPRRNQLFTYDFGNLGSEIKKRSKGKKWAQRFPKKSWPSVKQFCRSAKLLRGESKSCLPEEEQESAAEIKSIWDNYLEAKKNKQANQSAGGKRSSESDLSVSHNGPQSGVPA